MKRRKTKKKRVEKRKGGREKEGGRKGTLMVTQALEINQKEY